MKTRLYLVSTAVTIAALLYGSAVFAQEAKQERTLGTLRTSEIETSVKNYLADVAPDLDLPTGVNLENNIDGISFEDGRLVWDITAMAPLSEAEVTKVKDIARDVVLAEALGQGFPYRLLDDDYKFLFPGSITINVNVPISPSDQPTVESPIHEQATDEPTDSYPQVSGEDYADSCGGGSCGGSYGEYTGGGCGEYAEPGCGGCGGCGEYTEPACGGCGEYVEPGCGGCGEYIEPACGGCDDCCEPSCDECCSTCGSVCGPFRCCGLFPRLLDRIRCKLTSFSACRMGSCGLRGRLACRRPICCSPCEPSCTEVCTPACDDITCNTGSCGYGSCYGGSCDSGSCDGGCGYESPCSGGSCGGDVYQGEPSGSGCAACQDALTYNYYQYQYQPVPIDTQWAGEMDQPSMARLHAAVGNTSAARLADTNRSTMIFASLQTQRQQLVAPVAVTNRAEAIAAYSLGCQSFWRGDYEAALAQFDIAVNLACDDARFWYFKGLSEKALGMDESVDTLARAITLDLEATPEVRRVISESLQRIQGRLRLQLLRARQQMSKLHRTVENTTDKVAVN